MTSRPDDLGSPLDKELSALRKLGKLGRYEEIVARASDLNKRFPENADILFLRGAAHYKLENYHQARRDWNAVLWIDSGHAKAKEWLGNVNSLNRSEHSEGRLDNPRSIINIGDLTVQSLRCLGENISVVLCALFVFSVMCVVSAVTVVGLVLLIPALCIGRNRFFLSLTVNSEEARVNEVFDGFDCWGKALLQLLSLLGIVLLPPIAIGAPMFLVSWLEDSRLLATIGAGIVLVCFFTWGFYCALSFSFAGYILAHDPSVGPIESILASDRLMSGNRMRFFGLLVLFLVIQIGASVCLWAGLACAALFAPRAWILVLLVYGLCRFLVFPAIWESIRARFFLAITGSE